MSRLPDLPFEAAADRFLVLTCMILPAGLSAEPLRACVFRRGRLFGFVQRLHAEIRVVNLTGCLSVFGSMGLSVLWFPFFLLWFGDLVV